MHSSDMFRAELNKAKARYSKLKRESKPTEYSVLSCLSLYSDYFPETFDAFCDEFAYDNDSISALNTYLAAQREFAGLKNIFSKQQLDELSDIK